MVFKTNFTVIAKLPTAVNDFEGQNTTVCSTFTVFAEHLLQMFKSEQFTLRYLNNAWLIIGVTGDFQLNGH